MGNTGSRIKNMFEMLDGLTGSLEKKNLWENCHCTWELIRKSWKRINSEGFDFLIGENQRNYLIDCLRTQLIAWWCNNKNSNKMSHLWQRSLKQHKCSIKKENWITTKNKQLLPITYTPNSSKIQTNPETYPNIWELINWLFLILYIDDNLLISQF